MGGQRPPGADPAQPICPRGTRIAAIPGGNTRLIPTIAPMITKWRQLCHITRRRLPGRWLGGGGVVMAVIALSVGLGQLPGGAAVVTPARTVSSAAGIATHYVLQGGGGNCSYPGPPASGLFAALSPGEYDDAAPCGSYLEVKGPDGSVRVQVIDQCPECKAGHIDLSEKAFALLAPLARGIIPVSYRTIANPPLPAPVAFQVKNGSSRYWLALIVMNTGNAIASVQVKIAGSWHRLARTSWNGWIAQQGAGPGPFTIRVTDTLRHQVTIGGVALKPGAVQRSRTWMYRHR
jgi:expansin (peptidoglycan-binding protein)